MLNTQHEAQDRQDKGASIHASLALLFVISIPLLFIGCPRNDSPDNRQVGISAGPATQTVTPIPSAVAFNGERALEHVRKQLDFGPRPPGSPELSKTRDYIINE